MSLKAFLDNFYVFRPKKYLNYCLVTRRWWFHYFIKCEIARITEVKSGLVFVRLQILFLEMLLKRRNGERWNFFREKYAARLSSTKMFRSKIREKRAYMNEKIAIENNILKLSYLFWPNCDCLSCRLVFISICLSRFKLELISKIDILTT